MAWVAGAEQWPVSSHWIAFDPDSLPGGKAAAFAVRDLRRSKNTGGAA